MVWDTIHEKQHIGLWLLGLDESHPPPDNIPVNKLLWGGAGGAGKGEFDRMVAYELARQWPGSKGAIFRRKTTDVYETQARPLAQRVPSSLGTLHSVNNKWVFSWANGSECQFHHCAAPEDYWGYGSYEWDWIILDEATQFTVDQILYLFSRVRSTRDGWWPIFVATTNPPGESQQYWLENFVEGREDDPVPVPFWGERIPGTNFRYRCAYQPASLRDNPSVPYEIAMAGMQSIRDPIVRQAVADGNWHLTSETMFTQFSKNLHVVDPFPIPEEWHVWRSLDWGRNDPFGCLWFARDPRAKFLRTYVYREYFEAGLSDRQMAKNVLARSAEGGDPPCRGNLCDPTVLTINRKGISGPNHGDEWRKAGLTNLIGANNRRPLGWSRVHKSLTVHDDKYGPELQIFRSCPETINFLTKVKRHKTKPEDIIEPDNVTSLRDEPGDCIAAEAMVLTRQWGELPMAMVTNGDQVMTRGGWRTVKDSWFVGSRQCMTVHLSNGRSVTATPEHRFWVAGQGWTTLDALRYGDILETCQDQNASSSTGSNSAATLIAQMPPTGTTTRPRQTIGGPGLVPYTRKSGGQSTAPFLPVMSSTTTMGIRSTTTRRIWSALPILSTISTIAPLIGWSVSARTSSLRGIRPLCGTLPQKDERGTMATPNGSGSASVRTRSISPVITAALRSLRQLGTSLLAFARITANQPGAALPGSITRSARAGTAAPSSSRISTPPLPVPAPVHVLSLTVATAHPVYDLQVADPDFHEFIVEGVLVHNCLRYGLMGAAPVSRQKPRSRSYRLGRHAA